MQTHEFLPPLAQKALEAGATRALINVRNSRPIFKVEKYRFSEFVGSPRPIPLTA